jgi:hypothetical protein
MSELLQLLMGVKPHPIPADSARWVEFDVTGTKGDEPLHCPSCDRGDLALDDFYVRTNGEVSTYCKPCTREKNRERSANRKETQCA